MTLGAHLGWISRTPTDASPRCRRKALRPGGTAAPSGGALEWINSRLDDGFRFESHSIRGEDKMTVRAGLALAVMMVMALGSVRAKMHERMRSLI